MTFAAKNAKTSKPFATFAFSAANNQKGEIK